MSRLTVWLCAIYTEVWSSVLSNMERGQGQHLIYFHMLYGMNTMITDRNRLKFALSSDFSDRNSMHKILLNLHST